MTTANAQSEALDEREECSSLLVSAMDGELTSGELTAFVDLSWTRGELFFPKIDPVVRKRAFELGRDEEITYHGQASQEMSRSCHLFGGPESKTPAGRIVYDPVDRYGCLEQLARWQIELHRHPVASVIVALEGDLYFVLQAPVGLRQYLVHLKLSQDDLILFPAGVPHTCAAVSGECVYLNLTSQYNQPSYHPMWANRPSGVPSPSREFSTPCQTVLTTCDLISLKEYQSLSLAPKPQ